ncbi:hypothetical protein GCM10011611_51740 [Aliidongia dinghuensis]|uniref:Flagellar hook-length control protein-like C-terminal domain-containing protein n=1 Tax=Aliidongia dinghuensis TaxID=1867774 RepID=A0A8J3E680_9PROT|nr:flagellar hook-length control protein FliK [Aliidongia dinghuensis]GGF39027.1 hypothetical protein GCM10011611_51740 [Aliidongia dinghuensis]
MSIAQFDATNASNTAAQLGAATARTTANNGFAQALLDAEARARIETQRQNAQHQAAQRAANQASPPAKDPSGAPSTATATKTAAKSDTSKTDQGKSDTAKTHDSARASQDDTTTAAQQQTAAAPTPVPPPTTTASPPASASPSSALTSGTDASAPAAGGSGTATAQAGTAAQAGDTPAPSTAAGTAGNTTTATAAAGPVAAQAAATPPSDPSAAAAPSLATLAALGLGRTPPAGANSAAPAGTGKPSTAAVTVTTTKAPVTVKPGTLTTLLPFEFGGAAQPVAGQAPAPAVANVPAANANATGTSANAAAETPASDQADPNADAPVPPAPLPTDPTALPTDTAVATPATEQVTATAVATEQHASLFAQGGNETASTALTSGAAPTAAGFATLNAGTTVSRSETAPDTPQGGQTSQAPLQPPAEQLAIAISRNTGSNGSQNFTIRLSPEKLGTVEVKLQVDPKGKTTANFVVEHAETLQLLKQDSQQLVQSLQNAGVDTNGASLSFSLKDSNTGLAQNQSNGGQAGQPRGMSGAAAADAESTETPAVASNRLYDIKA